MKYYTKATANGEETLRELENRRIAYEAACEGMVLLKNEGVLPLKTKKVALYGPGASMTIKGGTGSGEVNERHAVTVLEGMLERGFEVSTMGWIEEYVGYLAPVHIYPGEDEMLALAQGAIRVLNGKETAKVY